MKILRTKKKCFKCERVLLRSHFYKHPQMGDGLLGKCKDCAKNDVRIRYAVTLEARHAYESARNRTPKRKAALQAGTKKYRERYPERYKAHCSVSNALRSGKLIRRGCEVCGQCAQAHHSDYSKPLDVRWLCFKHHRELEHGQKTTWKS